MILQKLFAVTIYLVKGRLSTFFTNNYAMRGAEREKTRGGAAVFAEKKSGYAGDEICILVVSMVF